MCKISFENIIGKNTKLQSLLQNNFLEEYFQEAISINTQDSSHYENQSENQIINNKDKFFSMEEQIFQWFAQKSIKIGNPEEIISKYVQQQKAMIIPKKSEMKRISGVSFKMSSLMARRTIRPLQVNNGNDPLYL